MPRDIRSYFQPAKGNSTSTSTKASKRRIITSDDEDEVPQSPLKRSKKEKKVIGPDAENVWKKKTVSPGDIFGKSPVKREEAPKVSKKSQKKESETHGDVDFEATLLQLDTSDIEQKYLGETNKDLQGNEKKEATPVKSKPDVKEKRTPAKNSKDENGLNVEAKSKKSTKTEAPKVVVEHSDKKKPSPKEPDVYEEIIEKKKQHSVMYQQYLNRGGARNPGSKEVPVGAENCLVGLSFVLTGVLESLEREEAEELIKKYGGRVVHQVSKKVNYVILGDQPGPAKVEKARSLNVAQISEDDLLELIRTRPVGQASSVQKPRSNSNKRIKSTDSEESSPAKKPRLDDEQKVASNEKDASGMKETEEKVSGGKELDERPKSPVKEKPVEKIVDRNETNDLPVQALAEKYRPKTIKQLLGQQGDKSNAKKLYTWLMNWRKNQTGKVKRAKPSPFAKNDDGGFFKAALLSGPPGIGKTTTVQVVCRELGFDLVEFNASDTRSKKLLKEEVSELLSNTTLKNYFEDNKSKPSREHVLLMDEVDGMAGNEDRGGLQELISLIKSSDVPVVCICNDRNHPKMRTLSNYTFELKFAKPRLEQIRGAMKSICYKENIQMSNEDLDRLIEATNQDIRQVINHLSLFVGRVGAQEKSERKHANKDLKLGPWDVVRKVFSSEEHKHMNIHDKSDLFFHDYNISPLFVQENYLSVVPQAPKRELLERIADSAESIAMGDLVEKAIRSNNAWSLLPTQACFSSVIPGTKMSGYIGGQINFPLWLGKNSRAGKFNRLIQEITQHARLATGVSKEAINLDYLKPLRDAIVRPLTPGGNEDITAAVDVMNRYHLLREDLDSLIEVSLWPGDRDPMQFVDSKTKAAFTRAYNKNSAPLPYAVTGTTKKKTGGAQNDVEGDELEEEANSEEDDDNIDADQMIKAKKPKEGKNAEPKSKNAGRAKTSNPKPKRGRGRGK